MSGAAVALKKGVLAALLTVCVWLAIPLFVEANARYDTLRIAENQNARYKTDIGNAPEGERRNIASDYFASAENAKNAIISLMSFGTPILERIIEDDTIFDNSLRQNYSSTLNFWLTALPYNWGAKIAIQFSFILQIILGLFAGAAAFLLLRLVGSEESWGPLINGALGAAARGPV